MKEGDVPRSDIRLAVPTEHSKKRRRAFGIRDVAVTLVIALLIVGVSIAFSQRSGAQEGSFVDFNPFSGTVPSSPPPVLDGPAPDFEVALLDGGRFKLSEHRGHVVWINFWSSWCPPCRAEMPDIERVWRDEMGTDLAIVAINFAEDEGTVEDFRERLGLTFPIGTDGAGRVATHYRLAGFPSHFLVDRDGVLREIRVGLMHESTMRAALERLRSY